MKKVIPVFLALVLIAVIGWFTFGQQMVEKYTYSDERADLYEYFNIMKADEVAILLQDEMIAEKALLVDGKVYLDLASIHKYFNDRFYLDTIENLLVYTTANDFITTSVGTSSYSINGENKDAGYRLSFSKVSGETTVCYVALDYVKQYSALTYELFQEPNRMQIYTQFVERTLADVVKDNAVRYRGGIKSPILTDVSAGDTLFVLEKMETWTKVKTEDGFVGYIENDLLDNEREGLTKQLSSFVGLDDIKVEYPSLVRDHKIALGWHVIYAKSGNDTLKEVVEDAPGMNVISPTWFSLKDNEGNFHSFATQSYVDKAHAYGLEVWAAVDNFNYAANNDVDVDTHAVLTATTTRQNLVHGLVEEALKYEIDGINVDLEQIRTATGEAYVQFMRELSIECRKNEIVLSVDVPVAYHYNSHYDIEELGVVADYVIIMGYDEHGGDSGEAGSVASLPFVTDGLEITTAVVPSHKVINALPFYTRLWKTEGANVTSRAYGMSAIKGLLADYGMEAQWDEETNQNYARVEKDGVVYEMWLEDIDSILAKINVMKKYDLGGVAAWRLGFESQGIWDIIKAYISN
ncbi:MAG: SH3 domain-containing protein [Lachnospiraceae bacterium]|nr:SH3 domain-containing protein [Lachnospiraceae bacterium]